MNPGRPAYLETCCRQLVCIQRGTSTQLVTSVNQINDPRNSKKVTLFVHEFEKGNCICMAFCFELKNKKKVFLVVSGGEIAFEEELKDEVKSLDKFLFQWGEKTEHYKTLKSVSEPSKYLCVKDGKVSIQTRRMTGFKILYLDTNNSARGAVSGRGQEGMCIQSGDVPTCMFMENMKINDSENLSEGRYRQSRDMSTRMVVENIKINDDKNSSKEANHLEMLQDSTQTYLKTRNRKYMYVRSKDRSTRIVVQNIKISYNGNRSTGKIKGFDKYTAVMRQLNISHNFIDTTKCHYY